MLVYLQPHGNMRGAVSPFLRTNCTKMPAQEKKKIVQSKVARRKYLYSANLSEKKIMQNTLSEKKICVKHPLKKEKLCKAPTAQKKIIVRGK